MNFETPILIDEFFPNQTAESVHDYVNGLAWTYGWHSNKGVGYAHWNNEIVKAGHTNGLDITHKLNGSTLEAWNFIKASYLQNYIPVRCYANAHTYGVEGYPHTDSRRDDDVTVVIYMNKTWKRDWGGETVIYNKDKITLASVPAFNRAIIFKGSQWHCARSVSRICPERRMTLMFKCAPIGVDTKRDNLQRFLQSIGAFKKGHKLSDLGTHLLGTYDYLKAAGAAEHVCLAGGAHSTFGTNAYTSACLTEDQTPILQQVIGEDALNLVRLFSTINRPDVLEEYMRTQSTTLKLNDGNVVEVTKQQADELCLIEGANLYDQKSFGDKYPLLKELWFRKFKNHF